MIRFQFSGILLVSQLVLVLLFLLDIWATEFFAQAKIAIVYSRHNKNMSSGPHCVVTLFKDKVISEVNVEYQLASIQNTVCNSVEKMEYIQSIV